MPRVVDARWRIVLAFGQTTMMKYRYHFLNFQKTIQGKNKLYFTVFTNIM